MCLFLPRASGGLLWTEDLCFARALLVALRDADEAKHRLKGWSHAGASDNLSGSCGDMCLIHVERIA